MKKTLKLTLIVALMGSWAQGSFGQERGEMVERLFSRMDKNKDGLIQQDEAPTEFWAKISNADSNKDGKIDKSEAADGMKSMGDRLGRRGQKPDAEPEDSERGSDSAKRSAKDSASSEKGGGDRVRQLMEKYGKDGKVAIADIPGDLKDRLVKLDKNGDGFLDRSETAELRKMLADGKGPSAGGMLERMQQLFKQFDKDGDGKVALADLPEAARDRMAKLDANSDGMIEKSELQELLNSEKRPDGKPGDGKPKEGRYGLGGESTAPQAPKRPDSN